MGYSTLKAALDAVVKTNGRQEITGSNLNGVMTTLLQGVDVLDRNNPADTSGLNKVVLDKSKTFAEQVTGQNTIFEIRDSYDLGGSSVTIPAGSILVFNGGNVKNGTISGNKTSIVAADVKIFDNITFSGSFIGKLNACWVGAKEDDQSFDNSQILQDFFSYYQSYFKTIIFPQGNYYFLTPVVQPTGSDGRFVTLDGDNSVFYIGIDDVGDAGQSFLTINQESCILRDIRIYNIKKTISNGVTYDISKTIAITINSQMFSIQDVDIKYFDIAIYLKDVWYGDFSGRVSLMNNRIGVFGYPESSVEINTINFNNIRLRPCSADAAKALYPQNSGESESDWNLRWARCGFDFHCLTNGCKFNGSVIEGFDYGIRFNFRARSSVASDSGLLSIYNCYFEANTTYDIYVGVGYVINPSNLANQYRFTYRMTILECVFHTLKKVFLESCVGEILGCKGPIDLSVSSSYNRTYVIYDNSVGNVNRTGSTQTSLYYLGKNQAIPSNTGSAFPSTLSQSIKAIEQGMRAVVPCRQDGYGTLNFNDSLSWQRGYLRAIPNISSISRLPIIRDSRMLKPYDLFYEDSFLMSSVLSGGGMAAVNVSKARGYAACNATLDTDGIEVEELVRLWKAGTEYTGYVKQIFGEPIVAKPSEGKIYKEDGTTIIGFGKTAIDAGTISFTNSNFYFCVDAMCWCSYSYSMLKFENDIAFNGRNFSELRPTSASSTNNAMSRFICTTAQRDGAALRKRINCIIYNTTNSRFEIYTGTEWVELTDPFKRYVYNGKGGSLAERATTPDLPGQTFFNYATGITYTFYVAANYTYKWIPSIGLVDSLDHPNGYDESTNPIDYSTELSSGDVVRYNGDLYKWDGTQFVAL